MTTEKPAQQAAPQQVGGMLPAHSCDASSCRRLVHWVVVRCCPLGRLWWLRTCHGLHNGRLALCHAALPQLAGDQACDALAALI